MEGFSLSKFPRFEFTTSLKLTPQRKVFLYFSEISWQSFFLTLSETAGEGESFET